MHDRPRRVRRAVREKKKEKTCYHTFLVRRRMKRLFLRDQNLARKHTHSFKIEPRSKAHSFLQDRTPLYNTLIPSRSNPALQHTHSHVFLTLPHRVLFVVCASPASLLFNYFSPPPLPQPSGTRYRHRSRQFSHNSLSLVDLSMPPLPLCFSLSFHKKLLCCN